MCLLCALGAGLTKTSALRGSGRDVNTDERTAVGHEIVTGSSYDALKLVYPSCYPIYEPTGALGRAGPAAQGSCCGIALGRASWARVSGLVFVAGCALAAPTLPADAEEAFGGEGRQRVPAGSAPAQQPL